MIEIGAYTYGNPIIKGEMNNIRIGKYCSIGPNVILDGGWNHNTEFISTYPFHTFNGEIPNNNVCRGDITIGNDVWIGQDAIIMSGVTIGDGSVIGARSIITKNVQSYSVVVGNNRKVKNRFDPKQKRQLRLLKWWDLPHEQVLQIAPLLLSNNVDALIERLK